MVQNKGLIFKSVPNGWPVVGKDIAVEDRPIDLDGTEPPKDGLLIRNHYLSFDPYQRGRMRPKEVTSYSPAFDMDKPITNSAVSKVLKSSNSKYQIGDLIVTLGRYGLCTCIRPDRTNSCWQERVQRKNTLPSLGISSMLL